METGNSQLAGASPLAVNVMVDGRGVVKRRPGVSVFTELGTPIVDGDVTGMCALYGGLYFIAEPSQYRRKLMLSLNGVQSAITYGVTRSALSGSARPMFAVTADRVLVAGGEDILQSRVEIIDGVMIRYGSIPLSDDSSDPLFVPPPATHVVSFAQRLVCNDLSTLAAQELLRYTMATSTYWADWDPLDFIGATTRPDPVIAIHENADEIYAFGTSTLQIYGSSADPSRALDPVRFHDTGLAAAYAVVKVDDFFYWLDNRRRFVRTDGRTFEVLSDPIGALLLSLADVSDAWGGTATVDQSTVVFWVFPSDGRTFVLDTKSGAWSQWNTWGHLGHKLWSAKSSFHFFDRSDYMTVPNGRYLIGLSEGRIGYLDAEATTDAGEAFKVEVHTGFINHDTSSVKECASLRVTLRRKKPGTGGTVLLSWRDDFGAFCNPIAIETGTSGDSNPVVALRGLGAYRQREWKLELTDSVGLELVSAEEDFTVTGA